MRSFSSSSPLALTLAFALLAPAVAPAAVIVQSVTGNLLGAQSLLQFNPSLGTLTGVTFQLHAGGELHLRYAGTGDVGDGGNGADGAGVEQAAGLTPATFHFWDPSAYYPFS